MREWQYRWNHGWPNAYDIYLDDLLGITKITRSHAGQRIPVIAPAALMSSTLDIITAPAILSAAKYPLVAGYHRLNCGHISMC